MFKDPDTSVLKGFFVNLDTAHLQQKSNPFKLQKSDEKRSSYCSNITIFTCAARKTQLLKKLTARGQQARNANRKNGLVCYPTLWEPKKAPDQSNWPHYDQALFYRKTLIRIFQHNFGLWPSVWHSSSLDTDRRGEASKVFFSRFGRPPNPLNYLKCLLT